MVSLYDIFRTCRFCDSLGEGAGLFFPEVLVNGVQLPFLAYCCNIIIDSRYGTLSGLLFNPFSLQFCRGHRHSYYYKDGTCRKCDIYNAWSDGKDDECHMLPRNKPELVIMIIGAAVLVIFIFIIFEILAAPLVIVDARSDLEDPSEVAAKRIFTISVQGPIASLPKGVSRLVHQRVRYRTRGTGLQWLDFDPKKSSKAIKVRATDRRKRLLLQDAHVPFDCASCRGSMKAAEMGFLFTVLSAFIFLVAMLPTIIKVAVMSGNGLEHTFAACADLFVEICAPTSLF